MKKLTALLVGLGLVLSAGCASMPAFERSSETKMIVLQERVEEGQKSGLLSHDQSQMYLAVLKEIRTDYAGMNGRKISRAERETFQGRIDVLEEAINKGLTPPGKDGESNDSFWERVGRDLGIVPGAEYREPTSGERIVKIQQRIDDGRNAGAFSLAQGEDFQARLDYVRSSYLRMMEKDAPQIEEKAVISRLLDTLESDMGHVQQL